MKKTKTLFDQAIEIIEGGGNIERFIDKNFKRKELTFLYDCTYPHDHSEIYIVPNQSDTWEIKLYTRLLLARELWNDGQEKYWKQGLFK